MADSIENTGAVETQPTAPVAAQAPATEKTFTQAEVDALITRRLARATKGMPDEGEIADFRTWKETRQTDQQRINTLTEERDAANGKVAALEAEIEQLKRSSYIQGKGITGDEAEFIAFKAAKMVGDNMSFEQAVDSLTAERERRPVIDWTARLGAASQAPTSNNTMNALIRGARR